MADPWNLSLDQSCFEDWHEERIIFRGEDLTDVYKRINKLDDIISIECDTVKRLEHQLLILLGTTLLDHHDLHPVIRILNAVTKKLELFPENIHHLVLQSCSKILANLIEFGSQEDLKQYFESLNHILSTLKTSHNINMLGIFLEIIDYSYKSAFEKSSSVVDYVFKNSSIILLQALPVIEQELSQSEKNIGNTLKPLVSIGQYSCKLDPKSMAGVWKLILKSLQQHPSVCSELQLEKVIPFLVQELGTYFEAIAKNPQFEPKYARATGFLLKVIIGLINNNNINILENETTNEAILKLVIQLQRFNSDIAKFELGFSDDAVRLLENYIIITTHPFIENLLKTKQFKHTLERIVKNNQLENLGLFLRVLGLVMTPTYSFLLNDFSEKDLLTIFLCTIDRAHVELGSTVLAHGVRHSGQGIYTVPLYELLVTQCCSCLAVVPADAIADCVALLLNTVILHGFWAHLMASDVLTFLARYGSAQFCLELVQHVFSLNTGAPNYRTFHLLNRLVPLLSNNGRAMLIKSHPIETYPDVWASINWDCFSSEQQTILSSITVPTLTTPTPSALVILRLNDLSEGKNQVAFKNRKDMLPGFLRTANTLNYVLTRKQTHDYVKHIEYLVFCCMRVLLRFVQPDVKDHHLQLMQILKTVSEAKALLLVQHEIAIFLSKLGSEGFVASPQQPAILRVVANLFSDLLGSSSHVMQLLALRTFEIFLKVTPHASLASSCVKDGQDHLVKQFINRLAIKPDTGDATLIWKVQADIISLTPKLFKTLPVLPADPITAHLCEASSYCDSFSSGINVKRPRLESDEQLQFLLTSLGKMITDIGQLCPLPSWSKNEIRERISILQSYL